METAILVIVILCAAGLVFATWYLRQKSYEDSRVIAVAVDSIAKELQEMGLIVDSIRDVLTKASAIKAQKQESVFDRDTITPTNQKPRYVSLAIRRAQAERASLGPVTHDDRVRENNARAIESAG